MAKPFVKTPSYDLDYLLPIQIKIPVWLRDLLVDRCVATSQTASAVIKELLVRELGDRDAARQAG